jgi:hypothetical protein
MVPMSDHAVADHRTVEDIEREQRGRAAPEIIVGRTSPTLLHEARLRTVEGLNLRLFVDREHEHVGRGSRYLAQLGGKGRIHRPDMFGCDWLRRRQSMHRVRPSYDPLRRECGSLSIDLH